ncbi:hypothetical protein LTR85_007471 [Meristemomyces frigidus]|nr:hypothetical protein LTR85_007471 [Meristemomyces frigidus]
MISRTQPGAFGSLFTTPPPVDDNDRDLIRSNRLLAGQLQRTLEDRQRFEDAHHKLEAEYASLRKRNDEGQWALRAEEAEVAKLQKQLLSLGTEISRLSKPEFQVSDNEVRRIMNMVFYEIQNFAISALRDVPFAGSGVEAKPWLTATRKLLFAGDDAAMRESEHALTESAFQEVDWTLMTALPTNREDTGKALRKCFAAAFQLYRSLHEAKALFQMEMSPCVAFQPDVMTAVNSAEDDSQLTGKPIALSVFPGIYKFGDAFGEKFDEMTVICKARVTIQESP